MNWSCGKVLEIFGNGLSAISNVKCLVANPRGVESLLPTEYGTSLIPTNNEPSGCLQQGC